MNVIDQHTPPLAQEIKLIFFDVDGTLLDRQGQYSPRLKRAVLALRERGLKLAIASGRPPFACEFLFKELDLVDAGLFYTGGLVYEPATASSRCQHSLTQAQALSLLQQARELGLYIELYGPEGWYVDDASHPIAIEHGKQLRCPATQADLAMLLRQGPGPWFKFLLGEPDRSHPKLQQLQANFTELGFALANFPPFPEWIFASAIPPGADKHKAFAELLTLHGVTAEQVMSFGDAASDKVFLSLAGVGVAMAAAAEDVRRCANYICPSSDNDGVATALERLLGAGA